MVKENDLNPDIRIGLKLPFNRGKSISTNGNNIRTNSNIKNLLLTQGERVSTYSLV